MIKKILKTGQNHLRFKALLKFEPAQFTYSQPKAKSYPSQVVQLKHQVNVEKYAGRWNQWNGRYLKIQKFNQKFSIYPQIWK